MLGLGYNTRDTYTIKPRYCELRQEQTDPAASASAPPEAAEPRGKPGAHSWARELVETLLLTVLIFVAVRGVVQSFRVDGESMMPSLQSEELLLVNKAVYWHVNSDSPLARLARGGSDGTGDRFLFHPPEKGDVIVFEAPMDRGRDYIKRVIGVPGDLVEIHDEAVFVNGERLKEPYIGQTTTEAFAFDARKPEWRVPPGKLFVLGDNRSASSDSRAWDFVPMENVVGKATVTYWPASKLGGIPGSVLLSAHWR